MNNTEIREEIRRKEKEIEDLRSQLVEVKPGTVYHNNYSTWVKILKEWEPGDSHQYNAVVGEPDAICLKVDDQGVESCPWYMNHMHVWQIGTEQDFKRAYAERMKQLKELTA